MRKNIGQPSTSIRAALLYFKAHAVRADVTRSVRGHYRGTKGERDASLPVAIVAPTFFTFSAFSRFSNALENHGDRAIIQQELMMKARSPIGEVLIVDSDPLHAAALEDALHMVSCGVLVCSDPEAALTALQVERVDLVVVVPTSPAQWRKDAESLCDAMRQLEEQPQIVFVLRCPYLGPGERLFGYRLNIKVMYER